MKRFFIVFILCYVSIASAQFYRIRITDPTGNVAQENISGTNTIVILTTFIETHLKSLGSNNAERLASFCKSYCIEEARNKRREAIEIEQQQKRLEVLKGLLEND